MQREIKPRVSIGLPVFNGEKYLALAIESVLAQSFNNLELIISDNGSTDQTQKICETYKKKDLRVRYFRHSKNRGAGFNYNFVFQQSRGDYFKWIAHDDFIAPTFLDACVKVLDEQLSVILVYTKYIDIDEKGEPIRTVSRSKGQEKYVSKRFFNLVKQGHTCEEIFGLIRATTLRQTALIQNYTDSDRTLLGELSLRGFFYEVSEPLFYHRIHAEKSTKVYPVSHERAVWFDPKLQGRLVLSPWKQFFHMMNAIHKAPLDISAQISCYWEAMRWFKWGYRWMFKQLFIEAMGFGSKKLKIFW